MASDAIAAPAAGMDRYRQTEQALWRHYGLEPKERFIVLQSPAVRLRILEVGSGEPVLFVHGTVGPGGWPALVRELPGYRCLLLDRPGWGFSSHVDYSKYDYSTVVVDIRAGAVMVRLPDTAGRVRSILSQSGHGPSLEDGRIPDVFVEWRVAVGRQTGSMRHERDMVRTLLHGSSFRPGLTFDDAKLAAVQQPTLYLFGTADPVGTVDTWRRATRLLQRGELCVVEGAEHMPWFDDASKVAGVVGHFLAD
jgi:pimeloyl-ACP methyl ester carboxylesterase